MSEIEQLKAEKQELKEEIVFLKKELECSKKLRNRIQNDLLKSDRINDNLKAENEIILDRLTQYEEDADVQVCLFSDLKRLEQENDNLKNKLSDAEAVMLTYKADKEKYYQQTLDDEIQINELLQVLQEIKEYLNTLSGIDNDFVNTETYLRILDLITKAESEKE